MNAINWTALMEMERSRYENVLVTNAQRFRYWALKLIDAEYEMGRENILQTDCSGTVCFPLLRMGYDIRITAQELYEMIFTRPASYATVKHTQALFFRKSDGRIIHVTPFVGPDVCLNAGNPVSVRTAQYLIQWFESHEHAEALCRELDWDAADAISRTGQHAWGLDPSEKLLRGDL